MGWRRMGQFPVYPFLVAALPVIYFHEANFRLLNPGDGLRIAFFYWLITGLLLLGGRLLWRDFSRAAMVVAPLAVVLFLGNKVGLIASLIFLVLALVLGVLFLFRQADVRRGSVLLNLVLLVLAGMPIGQTVLASRAEDSPVPAALSRAPLELELPPNDIPPPDIYYLIMDGLGQPEFLEKSFHFPPQLLTDVLAKRDFKVLRHSQSNYQQTALSLSATLNLGVIHELLDIPDPRNSDRRVLGRLLAENRVVRALRKVGYDLVTFPSGYPLTRLESPTRKHHPVIDPTFLEYYVLEEGCLPLLQPVVGRGPADLSFAMRRNRLEFVFDDLKNARDGIPADRPVFVFAHVMAPHPPFVFGPRGEELVSRNTFGFADGNQWYEAQGRRDDPYHIKYCDQLAYVMKRLGEAVDGILASSPRPPVIIVQGDHGPGSRLNLEHMHSTDHAERFGIFNAWYLPPGLEVELAEGSSALNTFPVLFNALFDADLPRQADRFFYVRMSMPYGYYELNKLGD